MTSTDRWLRTLKPFVERGPSSAGEYVYRCLHHDDSNASASFNLDKGVFQCFSCGASGQVSELVQIALRKKLDEDDGKATYDPFSVEEDNVVDFSSKRKEKEDKKAHKAPMSEAMVLEWHRNLLDDDDLLDMLSGTRCLDYATVQKFMLGYDPKQKRFTIPIRNAAGDLVNVRKYRTRQNQRNKMTNHEGWGSPPSLFPLPQLFDGDIGTVLLVEGELDALVCWANGVPAVSGTGGALRWGPDWAGYFSGMRVFVAYDNDQDGRRGARKAAHALRKTAELVVVMDPLMPDVEKSDVTDWFMDGGTGEQLLKEMEAAAEKQAEESVPDVETYSYLDPTDIKVIGSMDSRSNGKPLRMNAMVTGRRDPTYSVPAMIKCECTMDYGKSCSICPMLIEHDGETIVHINRKSEDMDKIARFIDARHDVFVKEAKGLVGVSSRCSQFRAEVRSAYTVEELFVTGSVDKRSEDATDFTQRRVYNVMEEGEATRTNMEAVVVGTTVPSPKDRHNEFFSWDLSESVTSIDTFEITPDVVKRLKKFRPRRGQTPLQKMRRIADDMIQNVTGIQGRHRMHMGMDLVWHSVLGFKFMGRKYDRGWLEFLIVGTTRTGKTATAKELIAHYRLGHLISCEGATFAGLVGGVKQVGDRWTVQWGEITLNDRRMVVLDEVSGLSKEDISRMSSLRSSGTAELTKVESARTKARCRMVWISNPREESERDLAGVTQLQNLIGNPEDIARFDLAMSVRSEDVPDKSVGSKHEIDPDSAFYTSDDCHDLILWCWSRKSEHVVLTKEVSHYILDKSGELSSRYDVHPPLLQVANAKDKIVRISVAIAARLFSTDETYTKVVVKKEHVDAAIQFVDEMYSYDNFGYRHLADKHHKNIRVAESSRGKVKDWLRERPNLVDFLSERYDKSFRSQDLEEMAFMDRGDSMSVISYLSKTRMLIKDKSQISATEILRNIVIELTDEMEEA